MLRNLFLLDILDKDTRAKFVIDVLTRSVLILLYNFFEPFQLMQDIVRAGPGTKDLLEQSSGSRDRFSLVCVRELSP